MPGSVFILTDLGQTFADARHQQRMRINRRVRDVLGANEAAAEGDQRGVELTRHMDAAFDQTDAPFASGQIRIHQRRLVRPQRIEEM
jgi:hypothetical protein